MTALEHTPGPWSIDAKSGNTGYAVVAAKPKRAGGTRSIVTARPASDEAEARAEARANARLIAAAPDLLVQLDVMAGDLHMLRKAIEAGDPRNELLVRVNDMLRETHAVLAKAGAR